MHTDHVDPDPNILDVLAPVENEEAIVAREWPRLERRILEHLRASVLGDDPSVADDVVEQVFGRADDDSPLPDFVARRLPPMVAALGAQVVEVWLLDSRFKIVERLAGYSSDRGALPRWEGPFEQAGLLAVWDGGRRPARIEEREYRPLAGETLLSNEGARQVVIALTEGTAVLGFVKAVFVDPAGVAHEHKLELYRLAHVLKHAMVGSEARRVERARDELANLGNRVTDAQAFLAELVEKFLPRVLALHAASIFLANEAGTSLVLARTTGLDGSTQPVYRLGEGLTGYVWKYGRSLRFPDDLDVAREAFDAYDPAPRLKSLSRERLPANARRQFLAVPLVRDREVVGVLRLGGRTGEWRFSEADEALANTVASQIVQIYLHLRAIGEGVAARATLTKTMELLQTAQTEAEMVRTTLAALTSRQGLGFNRAAFWSFDEDRRSLKPTMLIGAATAEEDQILRERVSGSLEQLAKQASAAPDLFVLGLSSGFETLAVPCIDTSEDRLSRICRDAFRNRVVHVDLGEGRENDANELAAIFGAVEASIVPLWASGACIGCLYVDKAFDHAPVGRDLEELILAHARYLAGAIRARRESIQGRRAHEFHRKLSSALVAPGDAVSVARAVLGAIHEVLGFERVLIYSQDGGDGDVRLLGSHGFSHSHQAALRPRRLERALVSNVLSSHHAFYSEASETDPRIDREWRELLELQGPIVAMPLKLGGPMTGILVINDPGVHPGTEFALQPFAHVLGVAVRTIAQDERLEARNTTIALLHRIQKERRLPQGEEVFATTLAASLVEIIPAELCAVYRPGSSRSSERYYERRGHYGYPESLRNTLKYARTGARVGLTSHVLSGKALNVPQVDYDDRWQGSEYPPLTEVLGKTVRAFMGVPLLSNEGHVLGAITMTRTRSSPADGLAFQSDELEQLRDIAEGVASVFEFRDTHVSLEEHTGRIDALGRADDRVAAAAGATRHPGDLKELLQTVADEVRRICEADLVVVYGAEQPALPASTLSGDFWHRDEVTGRRVKGVPRLGSRVGGEYFEDAALGYPGGVVPEGAFVRREGIVSFAHLRGFATDGRALFCAFVNYRSARRFSIQERKAIERFVANTGALVELAARPFEQQPLLRVLPRP